MRLYTEAQMKKLAKADGTRGWSARRTAWAAVALLTGAWALSAMAQQSGANGSTSGGEHPAQPRVVRMMRGRIHPPTGDLPKPGEATFFDATVMGAPVVLDKNWRLGIAAGTDPAAVNFDDSKWPMRDAKEALDEIDESAADQEENAMRQPGANGAPHPHHHGRPYAWFRMKVKLPQQHEPLALMVEVPVSRSSQVAIFSGDVGMELYIDGKLVQPMSLHGRPADPLEQVTRLYPVEIPAGETVMTLAVRTPFTPVGLDAYTGFFAHRKFELGAASDLPAHVQVWRDRMLLERLPTLVDSGLKMLLAVFLLALFWTQRDHREYLWLGIHLVFIAPLAFVSYLGSMGFQTQKVVFAATVELLLISAYFYFEFLYSFLYLKRRWFVAMLRYSAPLLLSFAPLLMTIQLSTRIALAWLLSALFATAWIVAWMVFVGWQLTRAALKKNYEAALLLLPLLLSVLGAVELASTLAASSLRATPMESPLTFRAGPVPVHVSDVADFLGIVVILIIIFGRFQRIHRERQRASSELAAARSVQEVMIPQEAPKTPGFEVDTVYSPANEVGGDFFHIHPTSEGGLLVVIGDVAGKGLQAAMNVSMLMGALRLTRATSPGKILAELNRVVTGGASFTTCEAAYFAPDGELTLASAGHPAPYLNSQEIVMPGGLPLGVMAGTQYEEVYLYMHPGDRLLLVSDGIAEARRSTGELFGFDRIRNISTESAFFIADTAQNFGQEDDITVLTIRRLGAATLQAADVLLTGDEQL